MKWIDAVVGMLLTSLVLVVAGTQPLTPAQIECLNSGTFDCLEPAPTYQGPAFGWIVVWEDENGELPLTRIEIPLGMENATLTYSPYYGVNTEHRWTVSGDGEPWHGGKFVASGEGISYNESLLNLYETLKEKYPCCRNPKHIELISQTDEALDLLFNISGGEYRFHPPCAGRWEAIPDEFFDEDFLTWVCD